MRKVLLISLVLISVMVLATGLTGCGGSTITPTRTATSTFAFIRVPAPTTIQAPLTAQIGRAAEEQRRIARKAVTARVAVAGTPGEIAPGDFSVVLMKNDGTNESVQEITAQYTSVQLSYDGKMGVFSAYDTTGHQQVYVVDMTKTPIEAVALTTDANNHFWPQLSFDNSQVVFGMRGENGNDVAVVMSSTPGAGTPKVVAVANHPEYEISTPTFTPDGNIVFEEDNDDTISIMDQSGQNYRVLTNADTRHLDEFPSVSPDGKTVLFEREGDIYTADINGTAPDTNLKQLTDTGDNLDPMYVNDRIVFVSYRDHVSGYEVYSMLPDGNGQKRLTDNNNPEFFMTWSD
jgi:Tol biopolymer transport system component